MPERPMPQPRTPDPALPNEAGRLPYPWWWNDPETKAWIASGACSCRSCRRARKLIKGDQRA